MRALKLLSILLTSVLLVACTEVEFCESEHPHKDKLVVKVNWSDVPVGVERPKELSLYLWKDGVYVNQQALASVDETFVVDLPGVGNYEMMLISNLTNCSIFDTEKYSTAKITTSTNKSDATNFAQSIFVVPLGNVPVRSDDAVIMSAKIVQGIRPVDFKLSLNNAAFSIKKADLSMSGNAKDLLLYKNEAVNVAKTEVTAPLKISASSLSASYNIFGGVKDPSVKQILTLHIYPVEGMYHTVSIDITKYVNEFETKNPNKNEKLIILADGQIVHTYKGTELKISSLSVNGKIVDRGGDI